MPEVLTFRDFRGGLITAEDSADLQGWRRYQNLETVQLSSGSTAIRVRNPVADYTPAALFSSLDPLPILAGSPYAHPDLSFPVVADHEPYYIMQWTSGMFAFQINTMIVYRSTVKVANAYNDEYTWHIYSNAPYLSYVNSLRKYSLAGPVVALPWTHHETVAAPICVPEVRGGDVTVCFGPRYDYRILTHVGGPDEQRSYFNASASSPIGIGGQYARTAAIGTGGIISNSWLWDYGKLYQHWTTATAGWAVSIVPTRDATKSLNIVDDAGLKATFIVAPVYDRMHKQIGVPMVVTLPRSSILAATGGSGTDNVYFLLTLTGTSTSWNYRIQGFSVYMQIESAFLKTTSAVDYTYIGTISADTDIKHTLAGFTLLATLDITGARYNASETQRTWATDSAHNETLGRDLPAMTTAITGSYPGMRSSDNAIIAEAANITVKASGMVMRKKTCYAWGVDGDPGATRVRMSGVSGAMSHPDVFDIANVAWKPSSEWPILKLHPFDDRMLEFHATGVQFIDLPEYPVQAGTYLNAGDTVGSGLPAEMVQTLSQGSRGVFWANYEGVWVFRADRPTNIMRGRILEDWLALTDAQKERCAGGYNFMTDEYWLATPYVNPSGVWTFYVWYDGEIEDGHWRTVVIEGDVRPQPRAFLSDERKRFSVFGPSKMAPTSPILTLFNASEGGLDYSTQSIAYALRSQARGVRSGNIIVTGYHVERECADAHIQTINIYANSNTGVSAASALLGTTKDQIGIKPVRCGTMQIEITGSYSGGTRPLIKEISVYYQPDSRRRR